eukprot:Lankesteria_metandrocarpae@DN4462_c0_g1_i1.p1
MHGPLASPDIIWRCVRKNHAYLKKYHRKTFSVEAFNLTAKHTQADSSFCNSAGVDVKQTNNKFLLTVRNDAMKKRTLPLSANVKKADGRVFRQVTPIRHDLTKKAVRRYQKLLRVKRN